MRIAQIYLGFLALIFLAFGVIYLVNPMLVMSKMNFGLLSPAALTDVRATYGGLQIGMAVFQISCLPLVRVRTGLLATFFMVLGIGACRLVGLLIDGAFTGILVGTVVFELTLAALTLVVFLTSPKTPSSSKSGQRAAKGSRTVV